MNKYAFWIVVVCSVITCWYAFYRLLLPLVEALLREARFKILISKAYNLGLYFLFVAKIDGQRGTISLVR